MKVSELFHRERAVFSYEVFPARPSSGVGTVLDTLRALRALDPDFISVTYGAGGSEGGTYSFEIARAVRELGIEGVAHLPGGNMSRDEVADCLSELDTLGIDNILALRGDRPSDGHFRGDFPHASDLIEFIRERGDFCILAACYPEGHIESEDLVSDIRYLRAKVDAGADVLITQLFLDNDDFYAFRERCELATIQVPILAGIMPVTNKKQIERLVRLNGTRIPRKFRRMLDRYGDDPLAMQDAGIAYAIDQIVDLITEGADGIHLYTMNKPLVAERIYEATHRLW